MQNCYNTLTSKWQNTEYIYVVISTVYFQPHIWMVFEAMQISYLKRLLLHIKKKDLLRMGHTRVELFGLIRVINEWVTLMTCVGLQPLTWHSLANKVILQQARWFLWNFNRRQRSFLPCVHNFTHGISIYNKDIQDICLSLVLQKYIQTVHLKHPLNVDDLKKVGL